MIAESLTQYQQTGEDQPAASITDNLPQVMVTESSAQYQRTGKCHMAHITDAAQLTHPISAEDVDMQLKPATPRPDMHDIATPQRSIGGRCRKWVVSTQDPSLQKKQMRRLYDVQQTV